MQCRHSAVWNTSSEINTNVDIEFDSKHYQAKAPFLYALCYKLLTLFLLLEHDNSLLAFRVFSAVLFCRFASTWISVPKYLLPFIYQLVPFHKND